MELVAERRTIFGKASRALRRSGFIPAELYGRGKANEHLSVSVKDFERVFRVAGENTVITLTFGGSPKRVLINDVAFDPRTEAVQAVDFYEVRLDEKIRVKVPLIFSGVAPAIKDHGGVLVKAMQEMEIEALPDELLQTIVVPLEALKVIGEKIHVRDIVFPQGVRIFVDGNAVVASAVAKMTEEEEQKLAEVVDVGTIKAEVEEKKAARVAETVPPPGTGNAAPGA